MTVLCHFYATYIHTYVRTYIKEVHTAYYVYAYLCMYIDPVITMEVHITNHPTIYQPLTLQCTATIVRDITSTVDIIWTTEDTQVRRVNNVTASSNMDSTSVYNDSFITPSLNISDIGSLYQCEVLINLTISSTATTDFIIPIPGMHMKCVFSAILILHA